MSLVQSGAASAVRRPRARHRPPALRLWWATIVAILATGVIAHAQSSPPQPPARAVEVAAHLAQQEWQAVSPGMQALRTRALNGVEILAFRIDTAVYSFSVGLQGDEDGDRVDAIGGREGAALAVNGGFFAVDNTGKKLIPVGLLVHDSTALSKAWTRSGGHLIIEAGSPRIEPTSRRAPAADGDIIQSKPVMIEPGGRWAMRVNRGNLEKRTLVCTLKSGEVIVLLVTRGGLSLYEAAWLFRSPGKGGVYGCDAALALDGGGSTQAWVDGHPALDFRGETPVHNALMVVRR